LLADGDAQRRRGRDSLILFAEVAWHISPRMTLGPDELVRFELFDDAVVVRKRAVMRLVLSSPADLFALREVLLFDDDAGVRALVPPRLAEADDARVVPWLVQAVGDERPSVREAAWNALGRQRAVELVAVARQALRDDDTWWVRRAVIRALAQVASDESVDVILTAFDDPFWRVRLSATQSLWRRMGNDARLVSLLEQLRFSPGAFVRGAAAWLLSDEGEEAAPTPTLPGLDADPAVTAAQWSSLEVDAKTQVALLGEPHDSLRWAVRKRLSRNTDLDVAELVLAWLDEPRVPHAARTAVACLEAMPIDHAELSRRVLPRPVGAGQASYACAVLAKLGEPDDLDLLRRLLTHESSPLRCAAAVALASDPSNEALVVSAMRHADVFEVIVRWWEQVRRSDLKVLAQTILAGRATAVARVLAARALLRERSLEGAADTLATASGPAELEALRENASLEGAAVTLITPARSAEFEVHRESASLEGAEGKRAALDVLRESAVLEGAAGALSIEALPAAERTRHRTSPDPWHRRAALTPDHALTVAKSDPDPSTRRAAAALLLKHRASLSPSERRAAFSALVDQPDPHLRVTACSLVAPEDVELLPALLRLSRDSSEAVRSAFVAAIEHLSNLHESLKTFLSTERDPLLRRTAYSFLLKSADAGSLQLLDEALRRTDEDALVREHLLALTILFSDEQLATFPEVRALRPTRRVTAAVVARHALLPPGRDLRLLGGVQVSSLTLSGANGLDVSGYVSAVERGVTSFFWEPDSRELTRFLSHRPTAPLSIIAGSYESGAAALRKDVTRQLRILRRDALDVFLLFWVRSPSRLSDENLETLEQLRQEGLIHTFGFSTHLRDVGADAIVRGRWPVVMTRYSAAHPGAEQRLLPAAKEHGVPVIAFTTTSYGQLLREVDGVASPHPLPTAEECYRFALHGPSVATVLSAPRSFDELEENLTVLDSAPLNAEREAALRRHGEHVRLMDRRFRAQLRSPLEGPARS
jgi:aryl-alcohol dehydrogenase-like predicted oxidoreductase/HEAT repeat protein